MKITPELAAFVASNRHRYLRELALYLDKPVHKAINEAVLSYIENEPLSGVVIPKQFQSLTQHKVDKIVTDANVNLQRKKDDLDLCLDKIAQHIRLDSKYREKVYGAILRRSTKILINGGRDKVFLLRVYNQLERMLKKRRGLTIPVGIDAQNTQHYREISTLVLVMLYLVKLLSKENIGCAVQVDHEGSVYSYPVYQDYIYKNFRLVGIIRDRDSLTLTSDVEVSLSVAIYTDLLMNSTLTMQWFGMFPDMQRLLYRSLQNVDESIFTQISEEFVALVYEDIPDRNPKSTNNTRNVITPSKNDTFTENNTQRKQQEVAPVERKPLKVTAGITSMLGQLQDKQVFNENSTPIKKTSNAVTKPTVQPEPVTEQSSNNEMNARNKQTISAMPVSAAMMALARKSQGNPSSENIVVQEIDFYQVGIDCIRTAISKKNIIDIAMLVTKDGEIAYEKCLIVPSEVWRAIAKERLQVFSKKNSVNLLEKELIDKQMLIKGNNGLTVLSADSAASTLFDVKKLSTEIQEEIDSMNIEAKTIEVSEITATMVK
ncbi:MAG: hypothetical protein MHMPM18_003404 [Marteilia pararefringens]